MKVLVDHVLGPAPLGDALKQVVAVLPGAGTPGGLLNWVVLAGLIVFALNSTVEVILTRSWIWVGQGMVYDLAHDLFARLQRCTLVFHRRSSVGDLMSRVTGDSWCVHTVVDALLFAPGQSLITATAMVFLMSRIDFPLTLLSLAVAPLLAGSSLLAGRRIRAAARAGREVQSRIHLMSSRS